MGKQRKQWQTLFSWAPKSLWMVTAAMKLRHLLLGRKAMTNLDNILKIRDITLLTKVQVVKAIVFPVVMYRCKSWTIKKVKCQRIDAFEMWYWRRLFRVPWTLSKKMEPVNPKGNQPWIYIGRTDAELKLQYYGHLMWRADLLGKTLMLRLKAKGEGGGRVWDG